VTKFANAFTQPPANVPTAREIYTPGAEAGPGGPPARRGRMLIAENGMQIGPYTLTAKGLLCDEVVTFEDWQEVVQVLLRMESSVAILLGDALIQAEMKWGVTYQQVAEATGREVQTLYNYVWVMSKVDFSRRRENLTFGHYDAVARMSADEQERWLRRASDQGWTVKQLREELKPKKTLPAGIADLRERFARLEKFDAGRLKAKPDDVLRDIQAQRAWLDDLEQKVRGQR
jgi:hypothetical protein